MTGTTASLPARQRARAVALRGAGMHRSAAVLEASADALEQALLEDQAAPTTYEILTDADTRHLLSDTHTRSTR